MTQQGIAVLLLALVAGAAGSPLWDYVNVSDARFHAGMGSPARLHPCYPPPPVSHQKPDPDFSWFDTNITLSSRCV